jgi:tetratricopeptide (TPR) repeat protein
MALRSFLHAGKAKFTNLTWLQWLLSIALVLPIVAFAAGSLGYWSGTRTHDRALAEAILVDVQAQFDLGTADLQAGRNDLARQRFEYVIRQNPEFPGAMEGLTQALIALENGPSQPVDISGPTPTPSPTPDTRPLEELYTAAQSQLQNQDWQNLTQTIASIRNIDPQYQVVMLDRMLFLALRMGGIEKILGEGNLGGGAYDLALAEKFAPLDSEANAYRGWAHLYQIGMSFWGVYPDKSIYYFGQLAAAAPYLRDLSGVYASERYRLAIIQYGDQFAKNGDWCAAVEQYDLAAGLGEDPGLQPTAEYAVEQCSAPDTEDEEGTPLPDTVEPVVTATVTPTIGQTEGITATPTTQSTATLAAPTNTLAPSATLAPTTSAPLPSPTSTPTPESGE